MNTRDKQIAFVGGGNMAEAVLAGLIRQNTVGRETILVCEKSAERRSALQSRYQVETTEDNSQAPRRSLTVFLAVKPQVLAVVKDDLCPSLTADHLVISILAGARRDALAAALGDRAEIVRVMPNLPAQVGQGVSAITFPESLDSARRDWVIRILRSVGQVVEVEEPLQDVVTAVSGSGPGYLFFLAQHWIQAGVDQGLSPEVSRRLVTETLAGSAALLRESPDSPEELVRKVATPGGTTEAGLSALREGNLSSLVCETVRRATERSKELNRR